MLSDPSVLVPPVLVLLLAFYTRNVIIALGCGILSAAAIAAHYSPIAMVRIIAHALWEQADTSNIYIFGFLVFLGILITIMSHTGGTRAYAEYIKKIIHTRRNAETASLVLSTSFAIDDFFSSITVGSIMKSATDHFHVPRAKLAYLIDTMAAPLVLLVPFSSWIPMLTKQLQNGGISNIASDNPSIIADPFATYVAIIPYMFYSSAAIAGAWFIVRANISFGLMRQQEEIARETSNVFGGKLPTDSPRHESPALAGSLSDFIIPITLFVGGIITLLLYTGSFTLFGGTNSFMSALLDSDMFASLFYGSLIAVCATIAWFATQRKLSLSSLPQLTWEGVMIMSGSIQVLILAWTFGTILKDYLDTGTYLATLVLHAIPLWSLPAVLFLTSTLTAIATGSSWGTIAVLTPLVIPMSLSIFAITPPVALENFTAIIPILGALFSGAVAGDHVSPISSTTLMSAVSSGSYHADHVNTQFQYALPALISSTLGFVFIGIAPFAQPLVNLACALAVSIVLNILILYMLNKQS